MRVVTFVRAADLSVLDEYRKRKGLASREKAASALLANAIRLLKG